MYDIYYSTLEKVEIRNRSIALKKIDMKFDFSHQTLTCRHYFYCATVKMKWKWVTVPIFPPSPFYWLATTPLCLTPYSIFSPLHRPSFNPAYSQCAWKVNKLTCVIIKFQQLRFKLFPKIDFWWIWHSAKQLFHRRRTRQPACLSMQLSLMEKKLLKEYRRTIYKTTVFQVYCHWGFTAESLVIIG